MGALYSQHFLGEAHGVKVAVFSDVQGNLPAMEILVEDILDWDPDLVVMNGDLINRGPCSKAVLLLFEEIRREHGWLALKGNHEDFVLACQQPANAGPEADLRQFADWTFRQLGQSVHLLADWPDHLTFSEPGCKHWVHVSHGTLKGNRSGISASVSDHRLAGQLPEGIELLVTGHTHKVFERHFQGIHILNTGSVGSPFDGDVRASYGRLWFDGSAWQTHIRRLPYDRVRAEQDFHSSGFLAEAGPLGRIMYEEWKRAELLMSGWKRGYQAAVQAGDMSLEDSVASYMASL